jgi:hypothetical protein
MNLNLNERLSITHVYDVSNFTEGMEGDDFLKKFEPLVAHGIMREVCDGCRPRPRNNGHDEDTDENGSTDTINHHENSQDAIYNETQHMMFQCKASKIRLTLPKRCPTTPWDYGGRRLDRIQASQS